MKHVWNFRRDVNIPIPPCASLSSDDSNDRLANVCRDHATSYRDVLEKYYEAMFAIGDDLLRKSQDRQMQQLRKLMEKETGEVMRQLQHSRKSEVKQLALVHKDKDELERMKREVDSTLVEKGVAERVRLHASYDRRRDELQKQHDSVRATLNEQKEKVSCPSAIVHGQFNQPELSCPFTDQDNAGKGCRQSSMCVVRIVHELLQHHHPSHFCEQRQSLHRHINYE